MKKYFIVSGLALRDNNRGTAALGYGSFSFLRERGYIDDDSRLLVLRSAGRPFTKRRVKDKKSCTSEEVITVGGHSYVRETVVVPWVQWVFFRLTSIALPFTKLSAVLKNFAFVAAINGGDGFSDIYNTATFKMRLPDILWAMRHRKSVILLPQTMGPFSDAKNLQLAERILKYASAVFVRDSNFVSELDRIGVKYELTNDLSYYMKPESWEIEIDTKNAVGINVSGLAYSNTFRSLSGQFEAYPLLIDKLISRFQAMGKTVYLIPHSYKFGDPEESNDDIEACQKAYERLSSKENVIFINKDLVSPQVKYLISRMSFFCGTRMHANYAAIFTGVPVFGLSYSYKFKGAFERNGIYGQIATINNLLESEVDGVVEKVIEVYKEGVQYA